MEYRSADVMRLWAAMFPLGPDITMTDDVLQTVRRDYMKLRLHLKKWTKFSGKPSELCWVI
jgi:hypothetical protein